MKKNHVNLSEQTYEYILNLIMTKQLLPGEKIPELKISQEFNISRTPVRDAMRQLANEGLIEIEPNRFAKVVDYDYTALHDIGILRIALDSMSIKLASLFGSMADFLKLKEIAQNCADAAQAGNQAKRFECDVDFHMELANISKNALLIKFMRELYMRVRFILIQKPNELSNEKLHIQQHFDITQALIDHDEKAALSIIRNHLSTFYDLRDQFPEGFFG
jgi:DNA-binding GntR family transcriptional regulator